MPFIAPALAARAARQRHCPDRGLLLLGLGAATAGDILMLKPDEDVRILGGAGCFAGMHVSYAALLWRRGARPRLGTYALAQLLLVDGMLALGNRK